jgi:hypothetical protein
MDSINYYKIKKYASKFNENNSLKYIKKFVQYKKNILKGGVIDAEKQALIEQLQHDINTKCKKVDTIPDIPFEQIKHVLVNNTSLANLLCALVLKKTQTETYDLLIKYVYTIVEPHLSNKKLLNETDFLTNGSVYISSGMLFTLFYIDDESAFQFLKNVIINTIENKKKNLESLKEQKNRIPNEAKRNEQIEIINAQVKTVVMLLDTLLNPSIFEIMVKQYIQYIKTNLILQYDEESTEYIREILIKCAALCSAKEMIESGHRAVASGQYTEDKIFSLLNGDGKYNDVLYKNVFVKNPKSEMKGELDLVVGSFNKTDNTYDIKEIYDIKNSAKLINEDVSKFNKVIDYFGLKPELMFDKRAESKYVQCTDCTYNNASIVKGYIYIKPITMNDKFDTIIRAISIYINDMKKSNTTTEFINIFRLFEFNPSFKFPILKLERLGESLLKEYILRIYKNDAENLIKNVSNFLIYQCPIE